jgi:hypothetical protein
MRKLRVLVGCERSGRVREAFRRLGFDAWSCDLVPADDGSKFHIVADVRTVLKRKWDMGIFFPDCTYLCSSGLHWNGRVEGRTAKTEEALEFVRLLLSANIPRIALENPKGCISTRIRPYNQSIQPYEFGDDASKETCLWLQGLPLLVPTKYVEPRMVCPNCINPSSIGAVVKAKGCPNCGAEEGLLKPRWANQTDSGQNRLGPSEDRARLRALTYQGIADAMAAQWSIAP